MANFERNDTLNDFRNYFTHSYSINRLLIFPIQFLRAQTSPPPLLKKASILRHPSTLLSFNFSCPVHKIVTIYGVRISTGTQLLWYL